MRTGLGGQSPHGPRPQRGEAGMALGGGSFQRDAGRAGAGSGGEGAHASAFQVHLIPPFLQTPGEGRVFVWRRGPWHTVNVGWSVPCSPLRWPPSPAHPAASVSALSAPCASRRAPLPAPAPRPLHTRLQAPLLRVFTAGGGGGGPPRGAKQSMPRRRALKALATPHPGLSSDLPEASRRPPLPSQQLGLSLPFRICP